VQRVIFLAVVKLVFDSSADFDMVFRRYRQIATVKQGMDALSK